LGKGVRRIPTQGRGKCHQFVLARAMIGEGVPVEALIVNYNDGYSPEQLSTMFADLDLDDVQVVIAYAAERA
jgi:hypothetical protein